MVGSRSRDGYINKPFEPHALLRAVRTVLGLPDESARGPDSRH